MCPLTFSYDLHRIQTVKQKKKPFHPASDRNRCRHFQRSNINCCYSSSSQSYSTRCTSDLSKSKLVLASRLTKKRPTIPKKDLQSWTLDQTFSCDNVMGNAIKLNDDQTIPYHSKHLSISRFLTYKVNKTNEDSRIFSSEKKVLII